MVGRLPLSICQPLSQVHDQLKEISRERLLRLGMEIRLWAVNTSEVTVWLGFSGVVETGVWE